MMALQLSSSASASSSSTTSTWSIRSHNYSSSVQRGRIELSPSSKNGNLLLHCIAAASRRSSSRMKQWSGAAKCSSSSSSSSLEEEEAVVVKVGEVTEVNKDTFWPIVKAAADKTVVLDMYTQWCGPCKIIAPKFVELSHKYLDVVFLKLDCNQENKALAKELGIRVVPTFKILKQGSVVKEVTGAKFDDLVVAIDTVRSSPST